MEEPERRDFWDSFGEDKGPTLFAGTGANGRGAGSAIGTTSVKKGGKDDFFDSFGVS